jgi:long-chain fatty acid transport protein
MQKGMIGMAAAGILFLAGNALAGAIDNPGNGIRGVLIPLTGIADDSSAIYYNPAGLANMKAGGWDAELFAMDLATGYKYDDNTTGKSYTSNVAKIVPNAYVATGLGTMGFGLGVSAPYGGSTLKYTDLPTPDGSLETGLGVLAITPTFAIKVMDNLSLGLGLSAYYSTFTKNLHAVMPMMPGVTVDAKMDGEYSGMSGYGASLGALYKVNDMLSVGLSYRSPAAMKISGKEKDTTTMTTPLGTSTLGDTDLDSTVEFTVPTYLTLGFGLKLSDALLLGISGQYMGYSMMDKYKYTTDGQVSVSETNYKDTFNLDLGAEYRVIPALALRLGAKYTPSGTKDHAGPNYAPIDTDAIIFGVGGSYKVMESTEVGVTAGYLYGLGKTHTDATEDIKVNEDHLLLMAAIKMQI